MDSLAYVLNKYGLKIGRHDPMPVEIPNTNRVDLAMLFNELGCQVGAEIGVLRGDYSRVICENNPEAKLYCVDEWKAYRNHPHQEELDAAFAETVEKLEGFDVTYLRMTSMEAIEKIPNDSLDFVYIDANHEWNHIAQDLYWWSRKVKPGGIVSGHDYYRTRWKYSVLHVIGAVKGYTEAFRIRPWFVLGTKARVPGQRRDTMRSWFWVKPCPI